MRKLHGRPDAVGRRRAQHSTRLLCSTQHNTTMLTCDALKRAHCPNLLRDSFPGDDSLLLFLFSTTSSSFLHSFQLHKHDFYHLHLHTSSRLLELSQALTCGYRTVIIQIKSIQLTDELRQRLLCPHSQLPARSHFTITSTSPTTPLLLP